MNEYTEFQQEIAELMETVINGTCPMDQFHLQVKALRMVYNSTDLACGCAILRNLLRVAVQGKDHSVLAIKTAIQETISRWGENMLKNYSKDNRGILSYVISICQERDNPFKHSFFPIILHALYQHDIILEKTIFDWEAEMAHSSPSSATIFFNACRDFRAWLHDAPSADADGDSDN